MFGLDKLGRAGAHEGDGDEPRDQRKVLVVGGLAVLLVLLLGYLVVLPALTGSSGTSNASTAVVPHRTGTATPKPVPTSVPSFVAPSPVIPVSDSGRDPFAPLPEEAAAAAAAAAATAQPASLTTGSTTSGTTATGSTTSGTTSSDSGSTSGTSTDQSAPASGTSGVQYLGRTFGVGVVEVDGQKSDVVKGATFGTSKQYTCVSISDGSITVRHGNVVKTLAKGESQTF